jgi:hypothetical protein
VREPIKEIVFGSDASNMRRVLAAALPLMLLLGSCGSGSSASTCDEYAAEVRELVDSDAGPEEIERFLEETGEHVAKLITDDPDRAQPCADAVFNALFTAEFANLEADLIAELGDDLSDPP